MGAVGWEQQRGKEQREMRSLGRVGWGTGAGVTRLEEQDGKEQGGRSGAGKRSRVGYQGMRSRVGTDGWEQQGVSSRGTAEG